jgi:hypothetical protein
MISQSWQQLTKGPFLKVKGKRNTSIGDGAPLDNGFLAYLRDARLGAGVSTGNMGE